MKSIRKNGGQPDPTVAHRTPESPKRGLMSGETLRATRQQLRLLCASGFCFLPAPYFVTTRSNALRFSQTKNPRITR